MNPSDRNRKRVLVTGGCGFLGLPTVRKLTARGAEVVVLDNLSAPAPGHEAAIRELGVRLLRADLRDAAQLSSQLRDERFWGVIHLASLHMIPYCVSHPKETLDNNVLGTQHLLDTWPDEPPRRFLFASTADVYAPSDTPHREGDRTEATNVYGGSKLLSEGLVTWCQQRSPEMEIVIARIFNAYGSGDGNPHLIPEILLQLRGSDSLQLGNVTTKRDYIHVDDVAEVLANLLYREEPHLTVNVGSGSSHSAAEIVERLSTLLGRPIVIERDSSRLRAVDRPMLEANSERLAKLLPSLHLLPLSEGLGKLLEAEGIA
jgi:UDP-glucose 4-epimerase